jgi:MFS family permease
MPRRTAKSVVGGVRQDGRVARAGLTGFRELPSEVRALVGVGFMVALGFGLVAPAIPLFAREFGVGRTAAGAVISAFALMRLVAAPFVGRFVNALGERVLLASGIAVVAVSSALAGLAQQYWQLLVLRGVGGVGSIMFSVSAASLLIRVTPSHLRGRAQGVWAGSFLIGLVAGPAVGTVASFSLRLPFFLYAGTLAGAGAIGLWALRHSELAAKQNATVAPLAVRVALKDRAYLAALAAGFAGDFALVGARSSLVPQFVGDDLHLGPGWVYVAFLVVSVVSGLLLLPFGHVADTRGRRPVALGGLALGTLGFALLPAWTVVLGLIVAMVLLGVASAADSVAPGAMLGDIVGARGGTVVAVFQMAGDLGAVTGPIAAGAVADAAGYGPAFLLCAAVIALTVPFVFFARETLVPRSSS